MLYLHEKSNQLYYKMAEGIDATNGAEDRPMVLYAVTVKLRWWEKAAFYIATRFLRWFLVGKIAWYAREKTEFEEKFTDVQEAMLSQVEAAKRYKDAI